jgi:hypothetical protein
MMQGLTRARAGSAAERLHPRVNVLTQMLPVTLRLKNNWKFSKQDHTGCFNDDDKL